MKINKQVNTMMILTVALSALALLLMQALPCHALGGQSKPTAVVVDADTNEPIEGAVAIAIWRKGSSDRTWFEGASEKATRIEEAVSDKEGKIHIDDFWDFQLLPTWKPHLTIYKPGYVCWDQEYIFPSWDERSDFDKEHRVVKMEKWKEGYSYVDHDTFIGSCTRNEYYEASERLFLSSIKYEEAFYLRESQGKREKYENERKEKKNEREGDK